MLPENPWLSKIRVYLSSHCFEADGVPDKITKESLNYIKTNILVIWKYATD